MRLGLKLVAVNGNQAVGVPAGRTLVVGRSPACDVPIRDLTVSRHHGEVEAAATGLRIRDLGSTNGTFINGSRVSEGVASPGARVAFGKVLFQVMEERSLGGSEGGPGGGEDGLLFTVTARARAQSSKDIAILLAADALGASGSLAVALPLPLAESAPRLRVRGDAPAERRAAALEVLLEIAKELSQQGETARLLDKTARLLLQALRVDRVEVLTPGDGDEMTPRVSKVRPGGAASSGRVPHEVARQALIERVALLVAPRPVPGDATASGFVRAVPAAAEVDPAAPPVPSAASLLAHTHQPFPAATTDSVQMALAVASADEVHAALAVPPAGTPGSSASAETRGADQEVAGTRLSTPAVPAPEPPRGTAICAPLVGMQATALGLVYVAVGGEADGQALGLEDLEFLNAFAGIVAVALENLQLMDRARAEAVASAGYRRHFAPFVAEQIVGQEERASLAGVRRRVATLCCEIQGLDAMAEELHPEEIASLLSELFGELEDVVFEHGGTLDKVAGAGLAALWGAPLSRQDDADQAVQAAIAMQRGLERLNGEWSRQGRLAAAVSIAIGMDLGLVFAGIVGNERRLDYLVLGSPAQRAAHLCAQAAPGEILGTESLLEALSSPPPVEPVQGPPAALPAKGATAGNDAEPPEARAYRLDWRTPPTLRQAGELPPD